MIQYVTHEEMNEIIDRQVLTEHWESMALKVEHVDEPEIFK